MVIGKAAQRVLRWGEQKRETKSCLRADSKAGRTAKRENALTTGCCGGPRYGGVTALKYPRDKTLPRARAGAYKMWRGKCCIAIF
jgi:hypothetical protein